jgi:hypothetical protein
VHLAVRGFSAQQAVSPAQIEAALEWLPRFHLEGLRDIIYAPRDAMLYPSLEAPRPHGGFAAYVQEERTIYIYRIDDPALFWHVLYHEVGHHVYFLVLGSAVKTRWTGLYPGSACPTDYGYRGAAEDFAECYALYAQDTRSLAPYPAKLRFMREDVFSGRPESLKERP